MAYGHVLEALADPTRRSIFERLRSGPMPVGRLAAGLPVTRPAVSQHLRVLERAALVRGTRVGRERYYEVSAAGIEELRRYLDGFWTDVLTAFAREAGQGASPKRLAATGATGRGRRRRKPPSGPRP